MAALTEKVKSDAGKLLSDGQTTRQVAKALGIGITSARNIQKALGLLAEPDRLRTKKASEALAAKHSALKDYDSAARLRVINKLLSRIEELIDGDDSGDITVSLSARDVSGVAMALGIALDKRKQEDAETNASKDMTESPLDELANRIDAAIDAGAKKARAQEAEPGASPSPSS